MKLRYVRETRKYGHAYVHANERHDTTGEVDGREAVLSCGSFGKSLENGGHKYKAWANYTDTGKPVLSRDLERFI